jgi:4-alpha-glucanotransferase
MTDRWGIDDRYLDVAGDEREVPGSTMLRLRQIIGEPVPGETPLVVRPGQRLPAQGQLHLEDGTVVAVDGHISGNLPFGYHHLVSPNGNQRLVIATPGRCFLPRRWRAWGWSAQLYATRSQASWGIGDFADLDRLARWSARLGAGFVLVNPLGAVSPVGPQQPSPYFPATRRFRNPIYLRVEDVPGADAPGLSISDAVAAGRALNEDRIIDRDVVWRLKRQALEAIWASGPPLGDFEAWYEDQPASLAQFARWSVLGERFGPKWRQWPDSLRRPTLEGGDRDLGRGRTAFHAWLQWLLDRQLAAASSSVRVIQDLPIGVDPDGFDAWAWQDLLALEASVGAPPDELNQQGQDWCLPPFVPWRLANAGYMPFIETIRSSLTSGGGLRIDHVMGLSRLWWIPSGCGPAEGAYVRYPAEDLLAIIALESRRAGAVVVGEDLGTIDEAFRDALAHHEVLSYRLLWFEKQDPAKWPARAMAAVTTHDLPTVAGLWDGSDLGTQERLGLQPNEESLSEIHDRLATSTGLRPDADPADAVTAAYGQLSRAPSVLLTATLDDVAAERERPNMPGADRLRPNWSIALPLSLDSLEESPTARVVAELLARSVGQSDATEGALGQPPSGSRTDN